MSNRDEITMMKSLAEVLVTIMSETIMFTKEELLAIIEKTLHKEKPEERAKAVACMSKLVEVRELLIDSLPKDQADAMRQLASAAKALGL